MLYINSFLFCGLICLIGQIILDNTKLTPGHVTSIFVVLGALLNSFGIYDLIIKKVGAGCLVPIISFGHSLAHSTMYGLNKYGILGLFQTVFKTTTAGIVAAIFFGFIFSIFLKSKD